MNRYHLSLSVALVSAFVLGIVATQKLTAQGKGPTYLITELEISNMAAYQAEFLPLLRPTLAKHGARLIAVGKPALVSGHSEKTLSAIIAFDDMETATAWFNSEEYKAAGVVRDKYATIVSYTLQGLPQ
jgi:uncharacterized protein (DUF1330 family)